MGEFKDSAYSTPPSLIRRADGQVIQLSRLLYLVARQLDGGRDPIDTANQLSGDLGLSLTPGQICTLIVAKLAPLGLVAGQQTSADAPPAATPLLALRFRGTLGPARAAYAIGTALRPLFYRPVIAAVIVGVVGVDCFIFSSRGLAGAFGQLLSNPADLLLLAALTIASAAFHECGHAAGCAYGGARPGRIGCGIYLVWPSFFTDVTDSYRLDRTGRLRTDLGGVYFNLVFMLLLAGGYALTGSPLLLLVIALGHLEVLQQMLPFVRFDGYFIMSDLVGVPDLFARVIPLLAVTLTYMLLHLSAANRDLWLSASHSGAQLVADLGAGRYAGAAVSLAGALLALLSVAGSGCLVYSLGRRLIVGGRRWSAGRSGRQLAALAAGGGVPVILGAFWTAQGQFSGW